MDFTTLGNTELQCSAAGLGCGGNSRLGLGRGASVAECVELVRTAIDAGVNFIDTAASYGTESIVGDAVKHYEREALVISTKDKFDTTSRSADVVSKIDAALKRLHLDYIGVFHLHGVQPAHYVFAREELVPGLLRAKEQGKIRHLGITEVPPKNSIARNYTSSSFRAALGGCDAGLQHGQPGGPGNCNEIQVVFSEAHRVKICSRSPCHCSVPEFNSTYGLQISRDTEAGVAQA